MSSGGPVSTNMRLLWPNTNVSPTLWHDTHAYIHTYIQGHAATAVTGVTTNLSQQLVAVWWV